MILCDFITRKYNHGTVKPFFLLVTFVAHFRIVCELRSSPRSCIVVKTSGNEPSLSTMQKKAPDEEAILVQNQGQVHPSVWDCPWLSHGWRGFLRHQRA